MVKSNICKCCSKPSGNIVLHHWKDGSTCWGIDICQCCNIRLGKIFRGKYPATWEAQLSALKDKYSTVDWSSVPVCSPRDLSSGVVPGYEGWERFGEVLKESYIDIAKVMRMLRTLNYSEYEELKDYFVTICSGLEYLIARCELEYKGDYSKETDV